LAGSRLFQGCSKKEVHILSDIVDMCKHCGSIGRRHRATRKSQNMEEAFNNIGMSAVPAPARLQCSAVHTRDQPELATTGTEE
jgi:hypothetical protein